MIKEKCENYVTLMHDIFFKNASQETQNVLKAALKKPPFTVKYPQLKLTPSIKVRRSQLERAQRHEL